MTIINLTRIPITLRPDTTPPVTLVPTPTPPRITDITLGTDPATPELPLPQIAVRRGDAVTGLPAPTPNTWYIVARVVADALADTRDDLLVPGPALDSFNSHGLSIGTFLRISS